MIQGIGCNGGSHSSQLAPQRAGGGAGSWDLGPWVRRRPWSQRRQLTGCLRRGTACQIAHLIENWVQLGIAEVSARAAAGRWRGCESGLRALVAAPGLVPAATVIRMLAARHSVSIAHLIGNWVQLGLAEVSSRGAAGHSETGGGAGSGDAGLWERRRSCRRRRRWSGCLLRGEACQIAHNTVN
jgi:hypothetical protein